MSAFVSKYHWKRGTPIMTMWGCWKALQFPQLYSLQKTFTECQEDEKNGSYEYELRIRAF